MPFIVQTRRRRHRDTQPRALDVDQHVATTTTRNMNANSEGGISLCVEDLYAVVSSWLACKDTIPEGWKTELGPMCVTTACFLPIVLTFEFSISQKSNGMHRSAEYWDDGPFQPLVAGSENHAETNVAIAYSQRAHIRHPSRIRSRPGKFQSCQKHVRPCVTSSRITRLRLRLRR